MPTIHGLDRRPWIAARKRSVQAVRILDSFLAMILLRTAFGLSLFIMLFTTLFGQLPKEVQKRSLLNQKRSSS